MFQTTSQFEHQNYWVYIIMIIGVNNLAIIILVRNSKIISIG